MERGRYGEPETFSMLTVLQDHVVVIHMYGDLDLIAAPALRACLAEAVGLRTPPRIVVDAEGLTFCDSTGLSVLMGALPAVRAVGGDLALSNAHGRFARMLRITGLDSVLPAYESVASAAAFLTTHGA
ncbi:anti-sigma factor antagonist [Microbispora amethystogenes]|uniref:Anti-sigma factor antagonist n=2 Tax=Microbispora TaxID=2005 RepID=A0A5J5JSV8_9ACTN|nr:MULTISPECIES: anti-sigma factor antagonist [Microbispora]KAA9373651.1 anti-sigma factor antagonist [Microbispora cellulosiformans]GIH36421.1 anti-sigma factor antagonist [Microbispora amethystogenes]